MTTRTFEFLKITEPEPKPRTLGRTSVADVGYPNSFVEGMLELWSAAIDVVKVSAFTLTADDSAVRRKLAIYNSYGVDTQAGGPVLEIARLQGKLRETIERIREMGFTSIEISSEALPTTYSREEEEQVASIAREMGLAMHGEIGKKFPDGDPLRTDGGSGLDVEAAIAAAEMYLDIGCDFVYVEGHLLRQVIGDNAERGAEHRDEFRALAEKVGLEHLFFEVPFTYLPYASKRLLQHWLVMNLGPQVNIANVMLSEIPELEVVRTGMFPVFGAEDGDHPYVRASAESPTGLPEGPWWHA